MDSEPVSSRPRFYGRKAVVVGTHHLRSAFRVASHNVALGLRDRGFDVLYLSAPLTPLHCLQRGSRLEHHVRWAAREPLFENGLHQWVPYALVAPDRRALLRSMPVVRHWWKTAIPPVRRVLQGSGFESADILYCDNAYQGFWAGIVRHRRFVFRVPDDLAGFPGAGRAVVDEQRRLASTADRVVFAGRELRRRFPDVEDDRALVIPNGVTTETFSARGVRPEAGNRGQVLRFASRPSAGDPCDHAGLGQGRLGAGRVA